MNNGIVKTMDSRTSNDIRLSCVAFFTKLRRNKQSIIALVVYFLEDMFVFDKQTYSAMWPIKLLPQDWKTALSRSWKKTPTAVGVSVSKLYVTFFLWCCNQTEGYGDCLLTFLHRPQSDTDTLGWTPPNEWSARHRGRYLHDTQQTQKFYIHDSIWIRSRDLRKQPAKT